jgi:hypothetical protein
MFSPSSIRSSVSKTFHIGWTTPTFQHELRFLPHHGTGTSTSDIRDTLVRVLCHLIIDHLPQRSQGELVSSLLEMLDFYRDEQREQPHLELPPKKFGRTTRTVRPEIQLPAEE